MENNDQSASILIKAGESIEKKTIKNCFDKIVKNAELKTRKIVCVFPNSIFKNLVQIMTNQAAKKEHNPLNFYFNNFRYRATKTN